MTKALSQKAVILKKSIIAVLGDNPFTNKPNLTKAAKTFHITVKVQYQDNNILKVEFGAEVQLWFKSSTHPDVLWSPSNSDLPIYTMVNPDGSYAFNQTLDADFTNCDELLLLVSTHTNQYFRYRLSRGILMNYYTDSISYFLYFYS